MKKLLALALCLALCLSFAPAYAAKTDDYFYILQDDGTARIIGYTGKANALTVPEELDGHAVTAIGKVAFSSSKGLKSITIPDSVSFIGDKAFDGCPGNLTLTVGRDSYAKDYCIKNDLRYTYPDANDWLTS